MMTDNTFFTEAVSWLKQQAATIGYGAITITIIKHDHKITRCEKQTVEKEMYDEASNSGIGRNRQ